MNKNSVSFNKKNIPQQVKRILGVDPGLAHTGFGIIDCYKNQFSLVSYGVIETKTEETHQNRLLKIYQKLGLIIKEFTPDEACMESLFFAKNVTSALSVAEAKGVISLCMSHNKINLVEYKPNQIKKAVSGTTNADKKIVQEAVKFLLKLDKIPKPDHASDALACAITHCHYSFVKENSFQ